MSLELDGETVLIQRDSATQIPCIFIPHIRDIGMPYIAQLVVRGLVG